MAMHGAAAPSNTSQADVPTVTFVVSLAQTLVLWVLLVENTDSRCAVVTVLQALLVQHHLSVCGTQHKLQKLGVHVVAMLTGQLAAAPADQAHIAETSQNSVLVAWAWAALD
jgi:hypothetical protein